MKVPISWLKEYIDISNLQEISDILTSLGIEVDGIIDETVHFSGVVVGFVRKVTAHPNADRLRIAEVFDGENSFQVVCGAPNCREGIFVAFAKIGACLTDAKGTWSIKKSKIRDVESQGMLCSLKELRLGEDHDGILELDETTLGQDVKDLYADPVLEISLTPNLGHCMSVLGIARELSAALNRPLKKQPITLRALYGNPEMKLNIECPHLVEEYHLVCVENIQVAPSPKWLVKRLELCGIRSVNNVVDVSNYVLLELGQPLHCFDFDQFSSSIMTISQTKSDLFLTTLDQVERMLPQDHLAVFNGSQIVAVAGLIGEHQSSVSDLTKKIVIEAACFNPSYVRRAGKSLHLKTDAGYRFERGVDRGMVLSALELAVCLLESFGGSATWSVCHLEEKKRHIIQCSPKNMQKILGFSLSENEMIGLLKRLECTVEVQNDSFFVEVPSYRNDLSQEVDLIEEIARLYGFKNIPRKVAKHYSAQLVESPLFSFETKVRTYLLQEGLQEFLTCDLISHSLASVAPTTGLIHVLSPKSIDYSVLRPSLLPNLLQVAQKNYCQLLKDLAGFEVGKIHLEKEGVFCEQVEVGIILSGYKDPYHYHPRPKVVDFFDLKGIIENLLSCLHITDVVYKQSHHKSLFPGKQAQIQCKGRILGTFGQVHPSSLKEFGMDHEVYFAELHLDELAFASQKEVKVKALPIFPSSERDWTMTVKKETEAHFILAQIQSAAPSILEDVFVLDLFESETLGMDRKNITWRFVYRDLQKTLDITVVDQKHQKLMQIVAEKLSNCIL